MHAPADRRLVVFDFDGTLADTWRDIATALNRTLVDEGLLPVDGPEVRFWIGGGALRLLEQAVPEAERDSARLGQLYERFRVHYDNCCLEMTETYPGTIECLDALEAVTLAVLSNKPARFLDRVLGGLGLKNYFPFVVAGDDLPYRKPDPRVMKHLLGQLDFEPEGIWMVGDSAIDVQTGRSVSAVTIGCSWGLRGRKELRSAGVDHLIDSPREIPVIVAAG